MAGNAMPTKSKVKNDPIKWNTDNVINLYKNCVSNNEGGKQIAT